MQLAYLEFMTNLKNEEIERDGFPVNHWNIQKMNLREKAELAKGSFGNVDVEDHYPESKEESSDEDDYMTVEVSFYYIHNVIFNFEYMIM